MGKLEVELTPRQVQEKQFHDAFRGYNHEEVDRFLDEVAEAFAAAHKEREECRSRIEELERELERARSTEEMLKRTLLHAKQTADEAIREARATSDRIVTESERKASELVTDAKRRAHTIMERARSGVRDLEERADELRRFEHDYRAQLRAFLDSQLRALSGRAIHAQRRLGVAGAPQRGDEGPPASSRELAESSPEEVPTAGRDQPEGEGDMDVEEVLPDLETALEPAGKADGAPERRAGSEEAGADAGGVARSQEHEALPPRQGLQ